MTRILPLLLLLLLGGCSDGSVSIVEGKDTTPTVGNDTTSPPRDTSSSDVSGTDTATTTPADTSTGGDSTTGTCDINNDSWPAFGFEIAYYDPDDTTTTNEDESSILYFSDSSTSIPTDSLEIGLYYGMGAPTDSAFSFSFTGENYETCAVCALAHLDCGEDACATSFLAVSGTIDITSQGQVGSAFKGTLSNMTFKEVSINENTFESTEVAGGKTWCIGYHDFDLTLE